MRVAFLDTIADGLDARVDELGYEDAMGNGNPLRVATQMARYLPRAYARRATS